MIDGHSAIDKVSVMCYYDGCSLAQNEQFMLEWKSWLMDNCGIQANQISAGVDPNDPQMSGDALKEWIKFAKDNGFNTAIWDNPGIDDFVDHDWGNKIRKMYEDA